ncbi:copper resistance CopC family protein [Blastococcus sp. TF02A-26]|uniref:copper resistance CopC family protein n=1 Tax=Blastococcus sp. TF02A-26 TaxID=2250577 RepID=UPI000DE9B621|nr:copper resistance CopC family protein [Blastococcus sp. TF02A-26]
MSRRPPAPGTPLRRLLSTLALGTALSVVLVGLGIPAASAHDALTGATPADGSSVTTAPAEVALEFSGVVQELGAEVAVTGPDGTDATRGAAEVVGTTLTQPLTADLPAGAYSVAWRVTSADGHPVSGTLSFTVAGDPTGTPAPVSEASAGQPAGSSSSGLVIGLGAAAVLLLALVLGARQLRGRR